MEGQVDSVLVLVLGPASIAALIGAVVWWLTHRRRSSADRDSPDPPGRDNLDER